MTARDFLHGAGNVLAGALVAAAAVGFALGVSVGIALLQEVHR